MTVSAFKLHQILTFMRKTAIEVFVSVTNLTFSLKSISVGVFKNGRVEIIANDQGNRITPSYVAFTTEGERLIGDAAKNQLTSNPENTVFDAKRMIGRTWGDTSVQQDIKYFPFKVHVCTGLYLNCGDAEHARFERGMLNVCAVLSRSLRRRTNLTFS